MALGGKPPEMAFPAGEKCRQALAVVGRDRISDRWPPRQRLSPRGDAGLPSQDAEISEADGRGQSARITQAGLEMRRRLWEVYGNAIVREFGERMADDDLASRDRILAGIGS